MCIGNELQVKILGVVVGCATGWDDMGEGCYAYYDFKSIHPNIKSGDCLEIDYDEGTWAIVDDGGDPIAEGSLFDLKQ